MSARLSSSTSAAAGSRQECPLRWVNEFRGRRTTKMLDNRPKPFDLSERSDQAMRDNGFEAAFSEEAEKQAQAAANSGIVIDVTQDGSRDLRHLLWSSIDNRDSLDLDQIEVAEQRPDGVIRVLVGVADVESRVPINSPIDLHASRNKCSIYTGVGIYPMLPETLSTDLTSLKQDADRAAVVISMDIGVQGDVIASDIYRAVTCNHARLSYESVGDWLEGVGPVPPGVAAVQGMEEQLRLQTEASERLREQRQRAGSLDFETIEAQPVMQDGSVVDLRVPRKNKARAIIENFMVSANSTMAEYLEERGIPAIQRVVRSPERWPRIVDLAARIHEVLPPQADPVALSQFLARRRLADPIHFPDVSLAIVKLLGPGEYEVVRSSADQAGHFGLAVHSYTHSTAPNRRFADVVIQRLIKAVLSGTNAPYTVADLETIAQSCTERENSARKVERLMRKVAAALMMHSRVGQEFDGIVTGASPKGTYVRLISPPVEGRVTVNECDLDVGDRARVRLLHTDPEHGFIDFQCLYER